MSLLTYGGTKRSPVACRVNNSQIPSCVLPLWLLHTHIKTSWISRSSFQFSHLPSITGTLWTGTPAPKSPKTARPGDKTPQTLFHYEAMIGSTAGELCTKIHSPPSCTCRRRRQTHSYRIHKCCEHIKEFTHTPPCFLIKPFQYLLRELHVIFSDIIP